MNNRALIGLSAAAMSALVATAVGCGEPQQKTYTPAEEPAATVEATDTEATETEAAETEGTEAETTEAEATDEKADETEAADDKAETTEAATDEKADEAAPAADEAAASASDATYTDGEYTASGKGIGGDVPVTVTITDGKIASVEVGDNSETQGIGSKAIEQLPDEIVAANGTEGVDAVSGASVTSKAIFTAVDDCLEQAQGGAATQSAEAGEPVADEAAATDEKADEADDKDAAADEKADETEGTETAADASDAAYTDGEYTASGKGIGGDVPVTVTITDGKVSDVTVGDNSETQGIGSKAIEQLPDEIVEANGTEGVDAVSGASVTSKAIFTAVEDCLEQAKGGAADEAAADDKAAEGTEAAADDKDAAADKADDAKADDKAADAADEKADDAKTDDKAAATDEKAADAADEKDAAADKADDAKADDKAAATDAKADDAKADEKADDKDAAADASDAAYTDGEYTASGKGIGGDVPVTVTIKDGKVSDVTVGDNSETQGIGSKAIEQLPDEIVAANGTDGVDAVSGASVTSKAIFTAVDDCLEQAKGGAATQSAATDAKADDKAAATDEKADEAAPAEDATAEAGACTDGEYTAEGKGIGGKVPVTVTIKDGKISDVTVGDNSETQGIGSKAIEQLPAAIVEANGTDGVDAVSGASVTSKAIFTAVDDCLEQAKGGAADEKDAAADEKADDKAADAADEAKADDTKDAAATDEKAADAADEKDAAADKDDDAKADDKAADAKADDKAAATDEKADDTKADDKDATAEAGAYTDGEYTAEGKGIGGKVPVTVTIKDGKISDVTVGDNSETQGIGSKAIEQLPAEIVKANGTDGVDAVSGASVTSKAIFTAVDDCLEQAKGGAADEAAATDAKAAEGYTDGEYTAEGKGIGGKVPVTVTIKDGKISDVTVGDNSETQGIGSKAIEQLPDEIVKANGTDGVDAVSGASVTSKAIFTAVEDCLEQAAPAADAKADDKAADKAATAEAGSYKDGEYTAEGKGIGGKVPVTVTIKDGKISDVTVGDNSETQGIGSKAIEQLPAEIVAANGTDGVDAVSGASVTSKAIFTAVEDCLEQAK